MEPASVVRQAVSCAENLYPGQFEALVSVADPARRALNVQLPTGYGKTRVAAGAYAVLRHQGRATRLLYVVPTLAQRVQFAVDGPSELAEVGLPGPQTICDLGYSVKQAILNHRGDRAQVFTVTIQSLLERGTTIESVRDLMATGLWALVIDEYHHYGQARKWTQALTGLPSVFRLALSATPRRPDEDEAFGEPDLRVSYRAANLQHTVKTLILHSYVYQIDALFPDGQVKTYTTETLAAAAGGNDPEKIERLRIERQMRWSPKYVSPLIFNPLDRLGHTKLTTGLPCQALVGAMCCSHAELVCDQIKAMYPFLRVDWVGTGPHGRTDEQNAAALTAFCPAKVEGRRRPQDIKLDVLVHVGKAGEGLDAVFVTEVVHLNHANLTNQNNQENGRAARLLPGAAWEHQVAYINVDSCSAYDDYQGLAVMDAMDLAPPGDPDGDDDPDKRGLGALPEVPKIDILDMRNTRIDTGEVRRMATVLKQKIAEFRAADLDDPAHPIHAAAIEEYRRMRREEAEQLNSNAAHAQWRDAVERAINHIVARAVRHLAQPEARIERTLVGDLKRRVSQQRYWRFKAIESSSVEELKAQYTWLRDVESDILSTQRLPTWLQ